MPMTTAMVATALELIGLAVVLVAAWLLAGWPALLLIGGVAAFATGTVLDRKAAP